MSKLKRRKFLTLAGASTAAAATSRNNLGWPARRTFYE
jgi:hypothetical protein